MLDDRSPQVESVQSMASELTQQGEESERQQVQDQVDDLTARWDQLTKAAAQRQDALEKSLLAAKDFHDKMEPFTEWLDATEKKLSGLDTVSSDVDQIEAQIRQQRDLAAEIREHKPELDDIVVVGQELMKYSTGDDGFVCADPLLRNLHTTRMCMIPM